jgi:hypothetical protein
MKLLPDYVSLPGVEVELASWSQHMPLVELKLTLSRSLH